VEFEFDFSKVFPFIMSALAFFPPLIEIKWNLMRYCHRSKPCKFSCRDIR